MGDGKYPKFEDVSPDEMDEDQAPDEGSPERYAPPFVPPDEQGVR